MNPDLARLYDLADELYRLAPWQWMSEDQLIGLRHPETGERGFISIMGASGTHVSLAIYLGDESLRRFNLIQDADLEGIDLSEEDMFALILECRQLQACFTTRDELYPAELREIKALGRKYRGANWPTFRSFQAGWVPKTVDRDEEASWLAAAMEQALEVAPKLRRNPSGFYRERKHGEVVFLTRERGADGAWRTVWLPIDEELYAFPTPEPGEFFAAKALALPVSQEWVECHFQLLPCPVGVRGKGATFPYVALSVAGASGRVLGMDVLSVETQSHEDLIASVPDVFLQQWTREGLRPGSIRVASELTHALLEQTAAVLKTSIERESELPALDQVLSSIMNVIEHEP